MHDPNPVPQPGYTRFFSFAKSHCCNYVPVGPWQRRHHCLLEPARTAKTCVLPFGVRCSWFSRAVMPLDPALQAEWERLKAREADPQAAPAPKVRRCPECGQLFCFRSNRQLRCPACAQQVALARLRKRVKRQRHKNKTVTL